MTIRTEGRSPIDPQLHSSNPCVAKPAEDQCSLLPAPDAMSGDPMLRIGVLMVKVSQQKRETDALTAAIEDKAEDAADGQRIAAMKDRADKNFEAGMVSGLSQVGAGAASLTGGLKAASALKDAGTAADLRGPTATATTTKWDGVKEAASGGGKIGETFLKKGADKFDRSISMSESEAKVHKRASDALRKEVDSASQHEAKVMQLIQEIKQSQSQCMQVLVRMA